MKSYLGADWEKVETGIRAYLSTDISLLDSTNISLLENSGKQLRPMVALLVARAIAGKANEDTVRFAIASELLHNATLLHDDVADESDERRGQPTVRKLMGSCVSVLVGDFWLVKAVRAILDVSTGHDRAIESFSRTLSDLAEGEMLQLEKSRTCDTTFADYLSIIYRKTASLFVATCRNAAMSAGASPQVEEAVASYAEYLGYAFQIRDDIFDYMIAAKVGKPVGVDVLEKKITLPLLGAFANVEAERERRIRSEIGNIDEAGRDRIVKFVHDNGGVEFAQKVLEGYVRKAQDALLVLPDTEDRKILCELAGYMAVRKN